MRRCELDNKCSVKEFFIILAKEKSKKGTLQNCEKCKVEKEKIRKT